jgi:hypothetical protein
VISCIKGGRQSRRGIAEQSDGYRGFRACEAPRPWCERSARIRGDPRRPVAGAGAQSGSCPAEGRAVWEAGGKLAPEELFASRGRSCERVVNRSSPSRRRRPHDRRREHHVEWPRTLRLIPDALARAIALRVGLEHATQLAQDPSEPDAQVAVVARAGAVEYALWLVVQAYGMQPKRQRPSRDELWPRCVLRSTRERRQVASCIFALPPAELAAHPADHDTGHHERCLKCDDIHATVE